MPSAKWKEMKSHALAVSRHFQVTYEYFTYYILGTQSFSNFL